MLPFVENSYNKKRLPQRDSPAIFITDYSVETCHGASLQINHEFIKLIQIIVNCRNHTYGLNVRRIVVTVKN